MEGGEEGKVARRESPILNPLLRSKKRQDDSNSLCKCAILFRPTHPEHSRMK